MQWFLDMFVVFKPKHYDCFEAAASELNDYPHFKENPYNIILISIANYRK